VRNIGVNSKRLLAAASRTKVLDTIAVVSAFVVAGAVIAATPADVPVASGPAMAAMPAIASNDAPAPASANPPVSRRFDPSGKTAMLVVGGVLVGFGALLRRSEGVSANATGPARPGRRTGSTPAAPGDAEGARGAS
jgi:hypothetical protein